MKNYKGRHTRKPLIMRVPEGIREQPAWIFIGLLMLMSGLGYVTGQADSAIVKAIGETGVRIWGGTMMFSGTLLILATTSARMSLEKLALRIMSANLLAYLGWILVSVPFNRTAATIVLCGALIALSEFRVWHLSALIKRTEIIRHELKQRDS